MKRAGHLLPAILSPDNLRRAFWQAARGKRDRESVRAFADNLEGNLAAMQRDVLAGVFETGRFTRFEVRDPKPRMIHAAAFPERVFQHALFNVCGPVLERWLVDDTFACRTGKGLRGLWERTEGFCRRYGWFLKMDIARYFDSVEQERLLVLLERRFKDRAVLGCFEKIIRSYQTEPGRGLPIGSLASQHFANFYLGHLDRWVKQGLRCRGYVRYMDDFVLWAEQPTCLRGWQQAITEFVGKELGLAIKAEPQIGRTARGLDLCGYRFFPRRVELTRRSKLRFRRRLRCYDRLAATGRLTEATYQERVTALVAFTSRAHAKIFRQRVLAEATGCGQKNGV